jgi:hypothetical protein
MGEPNFDVDIAVEGDGIAFGESLAEALGGRVVPHDRFGTAIVLYDGGRVDVATARTEFYDSPGALPTVEQASIRQDLYRRDFTINAMATSLRGDDFGRLVDYFGGLQDLQSGVVRVLHNLSFIDDPTRIFRAIRYENRYGVAMDAHTLALARACVEMNLVGELSSSRLRDELQALLSEERVGDSVRHPPSPRSRSGVGTAHRGGRPRARRARPGHARVEASARGARAPPSCERALRVVRAPEAPAAGRRPDCGRGRRGPEAARPRGRH